MKQKLDGHVIRLKRGKLKASKRAAMVANRYERQRVLYEERYQRQLASQISACLE